MKRNSTVLIVDDEPVGRETLEALLTSENYELSFAANGKEALAKAAEITPDIILLDVMMPHMDGFEVCRRLRANPRLAEAPIVMVTALDDHDSRLRGIQAGADDFVTKPYNRAELRARVNTITRLNRYRRLLAERAKFEWVVDQSNDGYLIVDDHDVMLYANSQARLYLDLSPDEKLPPQETFLELARKKYRCEPEEAWAAWPQQSSTPAAYYLVRPESVMAHDFWLQAEALDLPAGPEMGRVIRLRDVTSQMALQRDTWEFHSLLNHKLRTPLSGVFGSLEFLSIEMSDLSPAEMTQLTGIALDSVRRLRDETEDVLKYLEAPRLTQPGAGANLSQLASTVAKVSADLGLESATTLVQEGLGDLQISLSQQAIELVLWEVLENTKKFHPQQAPTVEIVASQSNAQTVNLQIRDDGVTLAPEQLDRAWTPYYQGEKYFTGTVAGMGLGLPMVASLVWSVGGTCRIHNREDGPGVVMELDLPVMVKS